MSVPGRKAGELGAPENVESEEVSELVCHPCSDEGQQLPAAGFCVDCCEYLCKKCYKHHCTPRQMKHHVLQDKTFMPRSKPQTPNLEENINKCSQHQGEAIKFKCRSHDQLVCGTCIAIDHRNCDGICYVETEYEDLEKKLTDLGQQVDGNIKTTEQNVTDIETYCSGAVESIGQFRKEINHFFDQLEHDVIDEANRVRDEDRDNMTLTAAKLDNMRSIIHSTISDLDTLHRTKQNGKLFPVMDKTKLEMQKLEDRLTQIQTDNKIKRYRFEPEKQMQDVMANLTSLGNLSLMNAPNDTKTTQMNEQKESKIQPLEQPNDSKATQMETLNCSKMKQTEKLIDSKHGKERQTEIPVPRTAKHETDLNLKSFNDQSNCLITGSALLPDNQLVIADRSNRKIKLVEIKHNKITSEIVMPLKPWDITKVNNTQITVTIPEQNTIQFLSVVSQSLSKGQVIKVNGQCYGIVHNDGTLIVTFLRPAKVEIINMTGTVLRSLMNDTINKQLFTDPYNIAISPDKTAVYVSDNTKYTVTCMTMDGTVKAVYKDDNLKYPCGLAVNRTGTVYVCDQDSSNIHQITAECTKIQVLLGKEHGVSKPLSITYCDRKDKLYVGMYQNTAVKVFQLK